MKRSHDTFQQAVIALQQTQEALKKDFVTDVTYYEMYIYRDWETDRKSVV